MNTNNILLVLILLVVLICLGKKEKFSYGYGKSFGRYHHPQECRPENNCFPGTDLRSQQYHNVCPPKYGRLNREKIHLQDDCQRSLGNFPPPEYQFQCTVDDRLLRRCKWKRR